VTTRASTGAYIIAIVWSISSSDSAAPQNRRSDARASSTRPLRTSHHGLSGESKTPIAMGIGQIHWIANGPR
jgi:hypothetical protein